MHGAVNVEGILLMKREGKSAFLKSSHRWKGNSEMRLKAVDITVWTLFICLRNH
jgi:hypothetical protein